ncbi:MAG: 4'-phosphopantetheinyl transferase family protein [Cellulosilyticaceae bacterium]
MKLYVLNIGEAFEEGLEEKLAHIPAEVRGQILKFKKHEDRVRKLYSRLLVERVLKENLGEGLGESEIVRNAYGKPYVKDNDSFYLNVSHAKEWIVCAVDCEEIGVDVEYVTPLDLALAERFFAENEKAYIFSKQPNHQLEAFYEIWTLKESYIKQQGKGLSIDLKDFEMLEVYGKWQVRSEKYSEAVYFQTVSLDRNYKLAVCSARKNQDIVYVKYDTREWGVKW